MFSPQGTYKAVGLFSTEHIIVIFCTFLLIGVAVFCTRKMQTKTFFKLAKIFAIMLTCMECFKIIWTWTCNKSFRVDDWVPLYFCSLFIYALWFAISKNEFLKQCGLAFIAVAGVSCGAIFILSPTTSFRMYPIFHFQCMYSILFHSLMVYMGFMIYFSKSINYSLNTVGKYCCFCLIFMSIAQIINYTQGSNLMFLIDPHFVPVKALTLIYDCSPILYTVCAILGHLSLSLILYIIVKTSAKNKKSILITQQDEEELPDNNNV